MPPKNISPRKPAAKTKPTASPAKGSGAGARRPPKKHRDDNVAKSVAGADDAPLCSPPRIRSSAGGEKNRITEGMVDWAEIIDLSDYDSSSGESFDPSLDDSSLSDGSSVYSFDLATDVKGGDVPSTRKPIQLPLSYDDSSSDEDSIGRNQRRIWLLLRRWRRRRTMNGKQSIRAALASP